MFCLELFFDDPPDIGSLISGSSVFSWGHYAKYSKSERDKYCMISFICEILKQKQTHSYREKIGGCRDGKWGWEMGEMGESGHNVVSYTISHRDIQHGNCSTIFYIWKLTE